MSKELTTIQIIHYLIIIINIISPYIFNDNYSLSIIILFNMFLVVQWLLLGRCVLSIIEDNLKCDIKNISDEKLTLKNSIFENMAYISPIIIPPLNTIICIYKILYNCNCI